MNTSCDLLGLTGEASLANDLSFRPLGRNFTTVLDLFKRIGKLIGLNSISKQKKRTNDSGAILSCN